MIFLYNIGIFLYASAARIAACFSEKARLFTRGRKDILSHTKTLLAQEQRTRIWMHCASLGEFEQGRPVIEAIKKAQPQLCIILTFFSPSGYEVKKQYSGADYIFYLPLDTRSNAEKFVAAIDPACALFVKYEFWYHYLATLSRNNIPAILFSAIFQPRHPFFKWYGCLHRKMLRFYKHIFVQDVRSEQLLRSIGISHSSIAGDTRFDRAAQITATLRSYPAVEQFRHHKKLIIAGSTWKDDEILLRDSFEHIADHYKLLIAPHEVGELHIRHIQELFRHRRVCFWGEAPEVLQEAEVCIVNTVGHLSFLYRYADIVWIGGGFTRTGIHNIIEPAVYGLPVCFGPNYERYREATDMLGAGAAHSVSDSRGFIKWLRDEKALLSSGNNARLYVIRQLGATDSLLSYLEAEKCFFKTAKKL